MKARRTWWLVYGAGAAIVIAALAWITVEMNRLEGAEARARADSQHQEAIRLALWRMDSWLLPRLGRETSRPSFEYRSFYAPQRAYTRLLYEIEPGDVLTPSPLMTFESPYIRLHFQVWPDGEVTSPQVPTGNQRDLAENVYLTSVQIARATETLDTVRALAPAPMLVECVTTVQSNRPPLADPPVAPAAPSAPSWLPAQTADVAAKRTADEAGMRQRAIVLNAEALKPQLDRGESITARIDVDALVPFWLPGAERDELLFARRVNSPDGELLQGFVCEWPVLQAALLEQVVDLFPGADLTPVRDLTAAAPSGTMLATLPVALAVEAPVPPGAAGAWLTPARSILLVAWLALLAALGGGALALAASIAFGERRNRFASAVTHELRTPLTTFRMYAEMLADGMVRDDEQRQSYLDTLKVESNRLATLVENVLAYARLERGRARIEPTAITLAQLLDRLGPGLTRRAEQSDKRLDVEIEGDPAGSLHLDVDAVSQILFNLVENACKYAHPADDPAIHLRARVTAGRLSFEVRDHGPGVDAEHARSIFAPFERGARASGDATPGVGLGLALSRGLARRLGGDLRLEAQTGRPGADSGACFRLTLPTSMAG